MPNTTQSVVAAPLPPESAAAFGPGLVGAMLVLVVLAGLALALHRRRPKLSRRLELLETLSVGPRRSLCLARVENRTLVLGISEAGVQLLTTVNGPAAAIDDGFAQLLEQSEAEQRLRARLTQGSRGAA